MLFDHYITMAIVVAVVIAPSLLVLYFLSKRKRYKAIPYTLVGPTDPVTGLCGYEEGFRYEEIKK